MCCRYCRFKMNTLLDLETAHSLALTVLSTYDAIKSPVTDCKGMSIP
jgi:hypothetical protein